MKALVIYKKSQYEIYVKERKNAHIEMLLKSGSDVTQGMLASHEQHCRTLESVLSTLEKKGFQVRSRYRASTDMVKDDTEIVFTVGGDGTLLWAQKYVRTGLPVFGINSDPPRSVGALCASHGSNFRETLEGYLAPKSRNDARNQIIERLEVSVNGNIISSRVLNDVLLCHKNPAAVSSYIIKNPGHGETQKSSGIWICTPTGSTGAMKSAGGTIMKLTDHHLQWKVREPYEPGVTRYTQTQGFIERNNVFSVMSKMREGILALDGSRDINRIEMGDLVFFSHSPEPLTLVK